MILNKSSPQFLFGFYLAIAYIPGWVGASISTGWLFLLVTMPVLIWFFETPVTITHSVGALFLIYASFSLLWAYNFNIGFFILIQLLVLGLVFCLGSYLKDIKFIIIGVTFGLLISDIVALAQYFLAWREIFSTDNNIAGLFVNRNIFCETSAILLVCLLVYKLYYLIPITFPALILIHSRAALLGLIFCFIIWAWRKSKCLIIPILLIVGLYFYFGPFDYHSVKERFDLWADTARGFKIFGNGIGSFEILYPLNAIHIDTIVARPKYAHNDLIQIIFELGLGTLILLVFLWQIFKIDCKEKYILYAVGVISFFSFPLHLPVSAFIFCLVAGFITRYNATDGINGMESGPKLLKRNKK